MVTEMDVHAVKKVAQITLRWIDENAEMAGSMCGPVRMADIVYIENSTSIKHAEELAKKRLEDNNYFAGSIIATFVKWTDTTPHKNFSVTRDMLRFTDPLNQRG